MYIDVTDSIPGQGGNPVNHGLASHPGESRNVPRYFQHSIRHLA